MNYNDLTDEEKAKLHAAGSPEKLLELARAEGRELSDEELEQVAGGWTDKSTPCPYCGAAPTYVDPIGLRYCKNCGKHGGF